MSGLVLTRRSPIGVDLSAVSLKAAQLVRSRAGWRVSAAAALPRSESGAAPGDAEAAEFVDLLFRTGFVGGAAVVGAPAAEVRSAVLELPPRGSGAPVEQICQAEAARMFRLELGDYELHSWEVPTSSERPGATQMAVSALGHEQAGALLRPLDAHGLEAAGIDLGPEALARSCAPACRVEDGLGVLVELGWSGLCLVVFREGEPVYERWLGGQGVGRLAHSVSTAIGVDARAAQVLLRRVGLGGIEAGGVDPIALARLTSLIREYAERLLYQVFGSVAYVLDRFHGDSVTALRLSGGGAAMPELASYLAELSGIDCRAVLPSACGLTCPPELDSPVWMRAIGHAMWRDER